MQQRGCEGTELLLSKYADNEATPAERERVDSHVALCGDCRLKLESYREVAAIFDAAPKRSPEPQLRVEVFREIKLLKEEEARQERAGRERPWFVPAPLAYPPRKRRQTVSRLVRAAGPMFAAMMAIVTLLGLTIFLRGNLRGPVESGDVSQTTDGIPVIAVPTLAVPITADSTGRDPDIPVPEGTKAGQIATLSPVAASATVYPTAALAQGGIFRLSQPTPVLEEGDIASRADWHLVKDPAYGYTVAYPPNWWTHVAGDTRYFYSWDGGGTRRAPYRIELQVERNQHNLTAETANQARFNGQAKQINGKAGEVAWLRYSWSDASNTYDELYRFQRDLIYVLRASVPKTGARVFEERWGEAQSALSEMSGRVAFQQSYSSSGYAPVLFLNGTRLWVARPSGEVQGVTPQGYVVRQFALSPDMRLVAFTTAKDANDAWGRKLYVADLDRPGSTPVELWPGAVDLQVNDIAWYGDRDLIAIAETLSEGFGLYKLRLPRGSVAPGERPVSVERIAAFNDDLVGAKGLAIAPDRQLITFLAPLGEAKGTDIYAVRPDGSDLGPLVSHDDLQAPRLRNGGRVLPAEKQAVKSYLWAAGSLEYEGYNFSMLLTCGDGSSTTNYRGGFLYSVPSADRNVMLDNALLGVEDALKMQIVHLAYSPRGKLAFTGYYNERDWRADKLAGFWVADVVDGTLRNVRSLPTPDAPNGITDLQWTPDGRSLIYRETIPQSVESRTDRYDGQSPFRMVTLDTERTATPEIIYP